MASKAVKRACSVIRERKKSDFGQWEVSLSKVDGYYFQLVIPHAKFAC